MSERNRRYIPAEWAEPGEGEGAPKLGGGVTVDKDGNTITARGRNRPDQRYELDSIELANRRLARALAEEPATVVICGAGRSIVVRSPSGNFYRTDENGDGCTCPDRDRLNKSDRASVECKHETIVGIRLAEYGEYDALPVGAEWVAEFLQIAGETAAVHIHDGELPATKTHNVWVCERTPEFYTALSAMQAKYSQLPMPEIGGLTDVD